VQEHNEVTLFGGKTIIIIIIFVVFQCERVLISFQDKV